MPDLLFSQHSDLDIQNKKLLVGTYAKWMIDGNSDTIKVLYLFIVLLTRKHKNQILAQVDVIFKRPQMAHSIIGCFHC